MISGLSSQATDFGRLDGAPENLTLVDFRRSAPNVDDVRYIPFDPHAANLTFMLGRGRYERASMIVTSDKPCSAWGEILGDEVTTAAMIDRLYPRRDPRPQTRLLPPQDRDLAAQRDD